MNGIKARAKDQIKIGLGAACILLATTVAASAQAIEPQAAAGDFFSQTTEVLHAKVSPAICTNSGVSITVKSKADSDRAVYGWLKVEVRYRPDPAVKSLEISYSLIADHFLNRACTRFVRTNASGVSSFAHFFCRFDAAKRDDTYGIAVTTGPSVSHCDAIKSVRAELKLLNVNVKEPR